MIKVKIFGVVSLKTNVSEFETNVKNVDELLGIIPSISRKEAKDLVLLVNGKAVRNSYRFKDGDEVVMLSPAGGG